MATSSAPDSYNASYTPPTILVHFFYNSLLPIDDPLSPLPPLPTTSTSGLTKPPRPFSSADNLALEAAWQELQNSGHKRKKTKDSKEDAAHGRFTNLEAITKQISHMDRFSKFLGAGKDKTHGVAEDAHKGTEKRTTKSPQAALKVPLVPPVEGSSTLAVGRPFPRRAVSTASRSKERSDQDYSYGDEDDEDRSSDPLPMGSQEVKNDVPAPSLTLRKSRNLFHRKVSHQKDKLESMGKKEVEGLKRNASTLDIPHASDSDIERSRETLKSRFAEPIQPQSSSPQAAEFRHIVEKVERDISGSPFVRALGERDQPSSAEDTHSDQDGRPPAVWDEFKHRSGLQPHLEHYPELVKSEAEVLKAVDVGVQSLLSPKNKGKHTSVPVGLSRLHSVEMPDLLMKPIYWSPVHDVSSVMRGTWFYKETMYPVESEIANLLEEGYEYIKPWTQTYTDEVNSCLEVGPEAELKLVYKLWPSETSSDEGSIPGAGKIASALMKTKSEQLNPEERARKQALEIAGSPLNKAVGNLNDPENKEIPARLYEKSSVIYANGKDAQILRLNLLPSVTRGRKPLGPIRKSRPIGIPVIRGFDQSVWDKIHPPDKSRVASQARKAASASKSLNAHLGRTEDQTLKVTDLVLVIHGIGQKLSERIESFHFTHAINGLRRAMNIEMESDAVQPWLRPDMGGIMVLPINWRSTLSLDDGSKQLQSDTKKGMINYNNYTLKDITADSIPAMRNLISDVMLDIPFYLSHHKLRMIQAVIAEANRVYRLWVNNNPGFEKTGRVHLVAHSLGSVMALDILTKQPTTLPKQLDLKSKKVHKDMFEFDTKSLFLAGSPCGFFLLLNQANLVPRRGRNKPGADGEDLVTKLTEEVGTYGSLAVDNIYNIMHYNDPIAYRVNASVDSHYAALLQPAVIPSVHSSWLQTLSYVFGKKAVAGPPALDTMPVRPTVTKLPSTIEMETHNFTQEEIAEKKMHLLNDNGQVDYYLSSGGGPLEIQYLSMLSAHSSYWILQDFVRFLVVEIGRKPGKANTLASMRAVKKTWAAGKRPVKNDS